MQCVILYFFDMNFIKIGFILISLMFFFQESKCNNGDRPDQDKFTRIRVINRSGYSFQRVSMFSMKFGDLHPNDTSEYKVLRYDPLRDDPLVYCIAAGKNLGRYLRIPDENVKYYTYVMDSVSNGILYVSSFEDCDN